MHTIYTFFLIFVTSIICLSLNAQLSLEKAPAYEHLLEVNSQWEKYLDESPKTAINFTSDKERIAFHLDQVITNLRATTPKHLSHKQRKNREHLLQQLHTYSNAKQFPINRYHKNRQPYFIDDNGTHCAVGYLIAQSGHSDLANTIKETYNYRYLLDMPEKDLSPWAAEFGFTIEELAWIQPGYAPDSYILGFPDGPNGPVSKLENDITNDQLIISGAFSEIGGAPCSQIGYYKNSSFHCLANGLSGSINDISTKGAVILAAGDFMHNGSNYPLARFENGTWVYYAIPGRSGAEGQQVFEGESGDKTGLVIQHNSIPGQEEIWVQDASNNWNKKLTTTGNINGVGLTPDGWFFGGMFNAVTVHVQGQNDVTIACNNLVLKSLGTNNWQALGSEVSDNVNSIDVFDGVAYISGACSNTQNVCVSEYQNGVLVSYIGYQTTGFNVNQPCEIKSFLETDLTHLIAGDFYHSSGLYHGNYLAFHHPTFGYFPGVLLDKPINQIVEFEGDIFMGGEFTYDYSGYGDSIFYLAIYGSPFTPVQEPIVNSAIQVFPNPASSFVGVKGMVTDYSYSIHDTSGRLVQNGFESPNSQIDLSSLSQGMFLLNVWNESGNYTAKFIRGL